MWDIQKWFLVTLLPCDRDYRKPSSTILWTSRTSYRCRLLRSSLRLPAHWLFLLISFLIVFFISFSRFPVFPFRIYPLQTLQPAASAAIQRQHEHDPELNRRRYELDINIEDQLHFFDSTYRIRRDVLEAYGDIKQERLRRAYGELIECHSAYTARVNMHLIILTRTCRTCRDDDHVVPIHLIACHLIWKRAGESTAICSSHLYPSLARPTTVHTTTFNTNHNATATTQRTSSLPAPWQLHDHRHSRSPKTNPIVSGSASPASRITTTNYPSLVTNSPGRRTKAT